MMTRNLGLDLLRFFAMFLVLGNHLKLKADPPALLVYWQQGGWIGVDLFFVLSGFLISSLLFKEYQQKGGIDTVRFLIRRGFKIYPAFWFFLLSTTAFRFSYYHQLPAMRELTGEILFLQNYLGAAWQHTWSLAVEEHFYIGIAGLFAICTRWKAKHNFRFIPVFFVSVAICCLLLRIINSIHYPEYSFRSHLIATHLRIDSLLFGVLISYLFNFHSLDVRLAKVPSSLFVLIAVFLLSPAFIFQRETNLWISVYGVILLYLGSGCLLIASLRIVDCSLRLVRLFGVLGTASYSIYLWHLPVNDWAYPAIRKITSIQSWNLYFVTYLIGSCVFGWVLNVILEKPILAIRNRFFPAMATIAPMKSDSAA